MKKIIDFLRKPVFLLSAAALLLALSTLGSAQAALNYVSDVYSAQMTISSIGVSLLENGERVSYRDYEGDGEWNEETGELLGYFQNGREKALPGKGYEERLNVENSGDIDTYVRVTLYKDWRNEKGEKDRALSPTLIQLPVNAGSGWIEDEKASTAERTVYYYTKILPAGSQSPDLSSTLTISPQIAEKAETTVSVNGDYKTTTTKYAYDDYRFNLTAEVDAVQTHNAREAIKSAWGVDVDVAADGTLSLQQ